MLFKMKKGSKTPLQKNLKNTTWIRFFHREKYREKTPK